MGIDTSIRSATLEDLRYIIDLAKKEWDAVGFIPKPAYESAITGKKSVNRRWTTCKDRLWVAEENGDRVGFVLASFADMARITQIAIQPDARLVERGKLLIDAVREYAHKSGTTDFHCGCADDLESNYFWQAIGWQKIGERNGIHYESRQRSDRKVNIYRLHELREFQLEGGVTYLQSTIFPTELVTELDSPNGISIRGGW